VLKEYLRRFEAQFKPDLRLREQVGPPMLTASYRAVCGLKEGKHLRASEITRTTFINISLQAPN